MRARLLALLLLGCFACGGSASKVGAACAHDADCAGGDLAVCLTDAVYVNGYCSRFCNTDADCGEGAFCELGTGNGVCVAACTSSADCRGADNYGCYAPDEDGGRSGCLPVYPVIDGGPPDGG